jgi:hypothetical protein
MPARLDVRRLGAQPERHRDLTDLAAQALAVKQLLDDRHRARAVAIDLQRRERLDRPPRRLPYLAVWSESAAPDTFERIAGLVDRLARRLEQALGAEDAAIATAA